MAHREDFITLIVAAARRCGRGVAALRDEYADEAAFLEALRGVSPAIIAKLLAPYFKEGVLEQMFADGQTVAGLGLVTYYRLGRQAGTVTEAIHDEALPSEIVAQLRWEAVRGWLGETEWYLGPEAHGELAKLVALALEYDEGLVDELVRSFTVDEIVKGVPREKLVTFLERLRKHGTSTPHEFATHLLVVVPADALAGYLPARLLWAFFQKVFDLLEEKPAPATVASGNGGGDKAPEPNAEAVAGAHESEGATRDTGRHAL